MGNIPILKPAEVCRILEKLGFANVRQRGSHIQYRHADGRCTTVPVHKGRAALCPLPRRRPLKPHRAARTPHRSHPRQRAEEAPVTTALRA